MNRVQDWKLAAGAAVLLLALTLWSAVSTAPGGGSGGGLTTGVVYVNSGANISNVFQSASSNTRYMIGPGTWTYAAISNTSYLVGTLAPGPLVISNVQNVVVEGSGDATVLNGTGDGQFFQLMNCTNVVLRNFKIKRDQYPLAGFQTTNSSFALGFWSNRNANILIENVVVDGAPDHTVGGVGFNTTANYITYRNCRFLNGGTTNTVPYGGDIADGAGVQVCGREWTIEGCYFSNIVRGVEIYSDGVMTGPCDLSNLKIRECVFQKILWQGVCTPGPPLVQTDVKNITVYDCLFEDFQFEMAPWLVSHTPRSLTNETAIAAIVLNQGIGHRIQNCTIRNIWGFTGNGNGSFNDNKFACGQGITLDSSGINMSDVTVLNCHVSGCYGEGIKVLNTGSPNVVSNVLIQSCKVWTNGAAGIRLNAPWVVVKDCQVYDNGARDPIGGGAAGIRLGNAWCSIIENRAYNTLVSTKQLFGIYINGDSISNNIIRNVLYGHTTNFHDQGWSATINTNSTVLEKFPSVITAVIDVGDTPANSTGTYAVTATGLVTDGDLCAVAVPSSVRSGTLSNMVYTAFASNDVVYLRVFNQSAGSLNPSSASYKFIVQ